jgi:hypothetical protein
MAEKIYFRNLQGHVIAWTRSTIRELPIDVPSSEREAFLERLIAEKPDLLGIGDSYDESDIEPPFCAFSQVRLRALNGRTIFPDLILLFQSGHVVIVEVKLTDNPELRDRQVVAQLLEYAACLAQCSEQSLFELFNGAAHGATTWAGFVQKVFPLSNEPERLARRLLDKFRSSKLHLIIACDEAPVGLRELVRGVVGQSALGEYEFRVVEITPFVSEEGDGVMFLPHTTLETEIVARSAVTVNVGAGQPQPVVTVDVTPLAEITDRIKSRGRRMWSEQSFFDEVERAGAAGRLDSATVGALRWVGDALPKNIVDWGTGEKVGSMLVIDRTVSDNAILIFYSDGKMGISFRNLPDDVANGFRRQLSELCDVPLAGKDYPTLKPELWVANKERIIELLKEVLANPDAKQFSLTVDEPDSSGQSA